MVGSSNPEAGLGLNWFGGVCRAWTCPRGIARGRAFAKRTKVEIEMARRPKEKIVGLIVVIEMFQSRI